MYMQSYIRRTQFVWNDNFIINFKMKKFDGCLDKFLLRINYYLLLLYQKTNFTIRQADYSHNCEGLLNV